MHNLFPFGIGFRHVINTEINTRIDRCLTTEEWNGIYKQINRTEK